MYQRQNDTQKENYIIDILVAVGEKGGVENVINMVAPFLQEQGMTVRVVQLISSGVHWVEEGIAYYTLLEGLQNHTLLEFAENYAKFLNENGKADCVLATAWPSMCYVAKQAAAFVDCNACKVISWLHAPVKRYEDAGYGSYQHLELADAHFAISEEIQTDLENHFSKDTVWYVYNPVDFARCVQADGIVANREQKKDVDLRYRLYYIGRVSEEKRIDLMIEGVAATGAQWELFVVGDDGNTHGRELKRLAKKLNVTKYVHWLGWKDNPWKAVKGADALVLASEYEGFPLTAIEAQANGLAVVSTPVSGITELIEPGLNGYIFPFGDWKALSDILYEIRNGGYETIDSDACRQRVRLFEKQNAVRDFYSKIMNILCGNQKDVGQQESVADDCRQEDVKKESPHMTRKQIYDTNVQLQSYIDSIVYACHTQNYDKVVREFTNLTHHFSLVLEAVFSDLDFYNQEMELVNPEGVSLSLQDILQAQENQDYVLLADLLELQLLPFLQSLQEAIRTYDVACVTPDVWEQNMQALEQKDNNLWRELKAYHEKYESANLEGAWQGIHHLEDTNSGAYTMAGQDEKGVYYYHSNVNPVREAADFARYYYQPGCEAYVLWGLGLGYHVQELLKRDDGIKFTVYESDMDVIYHCLNAVDLSACIANEGFSLIYDKEFTKIIDTLECITENFILHYPSLRHIENVHIREQMELFFLRDSGKRNAAILFDNNSRENFKNYDGYVDSLRPHFEGKDVVIVAAGPSLDKNVEWLKNKTSNMVIVAVETVFRKLIDLGIDMDYMIVTDANSRIYGHMAGLENQNIPMLYLATAYKKFAMNYQGAKYLICQNGYDKAEELAGKNGWHLYETGGSVSTTALDVCISLGAKSIAFIGLDLAYTDNLAHTSGTGARREAVGLEDMPMVPALGGGRIPASKVFIIYNKWIENRVKKQDVTMPVYDATEGGAIVPGLQVTSLKEYMEKIKE